LLAFDGQANIGVVKLMPSPAGAEWLWSLFLVHEGPAFGTPTNGLTATRGEAARELRECYAKFRAFYGPTADQPFVSRPHSVARSNVAFIHITLPGLPRW